MGEENVTGWSSTGGASIRYDVNAVVRSAERRAGAYVAEKFYLGSVTAVSIVSARLIKRERKKPV